jgi:hypothetical protein
MSEEEKSPQKCGDAVKTDDPYPRNVVIESFGSVQLSSTEHLLRQLEEEQALLAEEDGDDSSSREDSQEEEEEEEEIPEELRVAKAPNWCEDCRCATHNTKDCLKRPKNANKARSTSWKTKKLALKEQVVDEKLQLQTLIGTVNTVNAYASHTTTEESLAESPEEPPELD